MRLAVRHEAGDGGGGKPLDEHGPGRGTGKSRAVAARDAAQAVMGLRRGVVGPGGCAVLKADDALRAGRGRHMEPAAD